MTEWIYGRHTVAEHLRSAPESCKRLVVARGARVSPEILSLAEAGGIPVQEQGKHLVARLSRGGNHQGVCLEVEGWSYWDLEDVAHRAKEPGRLPVVVALDCVQDPRNLGAVLRVADGAGAAGVVIPQDRAAGVTPAVARASAGATASTPVARVVNLARALGELRRQGFWIVGAASDAETDLFDLEVTFPLVAVFGGEHRGLRPNIARRTDARVRLAMAGTASSLNVAVACGVVCYELRRRLRGRS